MSAIETLGLGGGSYPEESESEYKTYKVTFTALCKCKNTVIAKSREEAEKIANDEFIRQLKSYDVDNFEYIEGIEILNVKEG